jgi:hypothetical protein
VLPASCTACRAATCHASSNDRGRLSGNTGRVLITTHPDANQPNVRRLASTAKQHVDNDTDRSNRLSCLCTIQQRVGQLARLPSVADQKDLGIDASAEIICKRTTRFHRRRGDDSDSGDVL